VSPSARKSPKAHILTTSVLTNDVGQELPIIDVQAQAPNAAAAARLADASVAGLGDYLDSRAATDKVPDAGRLNTTGLGAAQTHEEQRGPGSVIAFGISIFVFAVLCSLLIAISSLARGWRLASSEDDKPRPAQGPVVLPVVEPGRHQIGGHEHQAAIGSNEPTDLSWKEAPEIPRHASLGPSDAAAG
jgi:hypothetical protein